MDTKILKELNRLKDCDVKTAEKIGERLAKNCEAYPLVKEAFLAKTSDDSLDLHEMETVSIALRHYINETYHLWDYRYNELIKADLDLFVGMLTVSVNLRRRWFVPKMNWLHYFDVVKIAPRINDDQFQMLLELGEYDNVVIFMCFNERWPEWLPMIMEDKWAVKDRHMLSFIQENEERLSAQNKRELWVKNPTNGVLPDTITPNMLSRSVALFLADADVYSCEAARTLDVYEQAGPAALLNAEEYEKLLSFALQASNSKYTLGENFVINTKPLALMAVRQSGVTHIDRIPVVLLKDREVIDAVIESDTEPYNEMRGLKYLIDNGIIENNARSFMYALKKIMSCRACDVCVENVLQCAKDCGLDVNAIAEYAFCLSPDCVKALPDEFLKKAVNSAICGNTPREDWLAQKESKEVFI